MAKEKKRSTSKRRAKAVSTDTAKAVARPEGRPTEYTPDMPARLIEMMRAGASLTEFAADVGVSRQTVYNWRDAHPEFLDALTHGETLSQAHWEKKLQGFMENPKANAPLVKLYFANRFNWHDKTVNEHSGPNGTPIAHEFRRVVVDPKGAK